MNPGRLEVAFAVDRARGAGEISTDGEPSTARQRRIRRTQLAGALFVALAFVLLQLGMAKAASASTGVPCPQTGLETLATDHSTYAPGSIVHVNGAGYAAGCDVIVQVTRPDGSILTGDGSNTPGSDTVTT